jgi:hypothetical protein
MLWPSPFGPDLPTGRLTGYPLRPARSSDMHHEQRLLKDRQSTPGCVSVAPIPLLRLSGRKDTAMSLAVTMVNETAKGC